MTALVRSWNSTKLGHITDSPDGETVKTRCGRILKHFNYGIGGINECPKCGSQDDFTAIYEQNRKEYLAEQKRKKLAEAERKDQFKRRLFIHRETIAILQDTLKKEEAIITDVQEQPAGTRIEFEMNGLKFKLSGGV